MDMDRRLASAEDLHTDTSSYDVQWQEGSNVHRTFLPAVYRMSSHEDVLEGGRRVFAHRWENDWPTREQLVLRPLNESHITLAPTVRAMPQSVELRSLRRDLTEVRAEVRSLHATVTELRDSLEQLRGRSAVHDDYACRVAQECPQVISIYHWETDGVAYFFTLLDSTQREDEYAVYQLQDEMRRTHQTEEFVFEKTTTLQRIEDAEADVADFLGPRPKLLYHRQG